MNTQDICFIEPRVRIRLGELLFFAAYGIYLSVSLLYISFYAVYIQPIFRPALFFCLLPLALKELVTSRYSFRTVIGTFVMMIFVVIINNSLKNMVQFAVSVILIYCARDIPLKKILRETVWIGSILFAFVIFSAYAGIIENHLSDTSTRARYFMGFRYALYGPTVLFNIIACDIYLHKEKMPNLKLLFYALVDYLCYVQTDSRLTFILTLFIIAAALLLKYHPDFFCKRKLICFFMANSFWISAALSVLGVIIYSKDLTWMNDLDKFLGGRFSYAITSLDKYGITLFGNMDISWVGAGLNIHGLRSEGTYLYVDNMYVQLLQRYGIVFIVLFLLIFTLAGIEYLRRKDYTMLLILTVLALHGIIDDLIMQLYYNSFLLAAGVILIESVKNAAPHKRLYPVIKEFRLRNQLENRT